MSDDKARIDFRASAWMRGFSNGLNGPWNFLESKKLMEMDADSLCFHSDYGIGVAANALRDMLMNAWSEGYNAGLNVRASRDEHEMEEIKRTAQASTSLPEVIDEEFEK